MKRNSAYRTLNLILVLLMLCSIVATPNNVQSQTEEGADPSLIPNPEKQEHDPLQPSASLAAPSGYRLPFNGREIITAGPGCYSTHQGLSYEAIDYALNFESVYAVQDGVVIFSRDGYNDGFGGLIKIRHPDGNISWYAHLSRRDVNEGHTVSRGSQIAVSGNTGASTGPHLHFEVRNSSNQSIWIRDLPNTTWYTGNINQPCMPAGQNDGEATHSGGNEQPTCPTSGVVILYRDPIVDTNPNASCGGKGEGEGWVRRDSAGWQNVPGSFNDVASSVRVQSGWSVKLYENSDRGGAWACRTTNDPMFWGQKMNNGSIKLDDNVSSFEVFNDNRCGTNTIPRTPAPISPTDNYSAADGRGPTLCWNKPGDPDGDPVEFYAEVYQSAVNANSGWISANCWRPAQLDGQYYNYQWRVKARDSRGAESSWSSTWHFSILRPNSPPTVALTRANDQTITSNDQQIWSNVRDWSFSGTAADSDGSVTAVDVICLDASCGNKSTRRANGTTSWNYQWDGLQGVHRIFAYAYDNQNAQSSSSNQIKLGIDQQQPTVFINLIGEKVNEWYKSPVSITLNASDDLSDIAGLYYRLDGAGWSLSPSSSFQQQVDSEGSHTLWYYAVDKAGNSTLAQGAGAGFKIDRTPPSGIAGLAETHGVTSGQWQKTYGLPTFIWSASSDPTAPSGEALSGVAAYKLRLEEQGGASEVLEIVVPASQQLTWTPNKPNGLRTGRYLLRGQVSDGAENWSAWTTLFDFRYDVTAPQNPATVSHASGISSEVWQRTTSAPNFTWPAPYDEGSGIQGYYATWGADPNATSTNLITQPRFQTATSLCGAGTACTGYLRLRSVDNVGNQAERWSTAFVLRYDDAPPSVDFSFAEGDTTTQSNITLRIDANDQGSGVKAMRFSHDGQTWTNWEAFAPERPWAIPAISRQSWPIYLQVRDGVELASPVVMRTIYLDVNADQPTSAGYRLLNRDLNSGSGSHSSASYRAHSTIGQVIDSARLSSSSYKLVGGYEAGSRALPLVKPTYTQYQLISGIFASGSGSHRSKSVAYQLVSTLGEPALPNNRTTLTSPQYQLQPGFLAGAFSGTTLPPIDPGPEPEPEPALPCPFPTISINNAALFTNSISVTLSVCAPKATEMMLSNDGGFAGAQWEPYASSKAWTLTSYGQHVLPRYVYAAFKDLNGTVYSVYFDDVIYDPTPPTGNVAVQGGNVNQIAGVTLQATSSATILAPQASGSVALKLNGTDDNSGIVEVQISEQANFSMAPWEAYASTKDWQPSGADGQKTVYVRFRDSAGNISQPTSADFALDRQAPLGGMAMAQRVIGPETLTTTVYLGAQDEVSGVAAMRVSPDPAFTDMVWRPYVTELAWLIDPPAGDQFTLYVQYRDEVGNLSPVYSDTAQLDLTPPVLYAEAEAGATLTRTVRVLAYDEFSDVTSMRLSNDPLFIELAATSPYTDTTTWSFDDRQVLWVQVSDRVGNWSEPYPVYAGDATTFKWQIYLPLVQL